MAKKLNSMRFLENQGVRYEVLRFPDAVQSASGVADYLGISPAQVYKTLVVMLPQATPILVLVAGNHAVQLKSLAQALGVKKLRMATQKEAESWTGLQVGGISALALHQRGLPVYIDRAAADLEEILVSAGQRGVDVRLAVTDLVRATGAIFVDAISGGGVVSPRRQRTSGS
jgi:Cys-tRNA(Pro)/Cys-tRNA(Cys) deacylase